MSNRAKRAKQFAALGGSAIVAAPMVGGGVAHAATYTVLNTNDSGLGSLRAAIEAANGDAGADTITFGAGVTGTITLESRLEINTSMTITGPGAASLTIDADDTYRALYLYNSSNIDVTISGLTVTGADSGGGNGAAVYAQNVDLVLDEMHIEDSSAGSGYGGGVYIESDSSLQLLDSEVTGNDASYGGGVYIEGATGAVIIRDTLISGNTATSCGGGLYFDDGASLELTRVTVSENSSECGGGAVIGVTKTSTATITDSTFSGNDSGGASGGGIAFEDVNGPVTIIGSTFSGNTAGDGGGGLYFDGILDDVSIVNTTISGNTAEWGGGIYVQNLYTSGDTFTVAHSTITGNTATASAEGQPGGGGIYLYNTYNTYAGSIILDHTVVAGNTAPDATDDGNDIAYQAGGFEAEWSMIGDLDGFTVDGTNMLPEGDPKLGPLADNGGLTMTHMPLAGSPLLNSGDPAFAAPPATDQRGEARVGYARIDVGAVEVNPAAVLPPTGSTSGLLAGLGAALLAVGGALHLTGRRSRRA